MSEEHPFGIRLNSAAEMTALVSDARVIGTIHDGELLIVENSDGSTSVRDAATGESFPLNRNRAATEGFLKAFAEYLRSGPPDAGPTIMTAEQAAERLRAFRNGQLRPASRPTEAPSHSRRLKVLRKRLQAIDGSATGSDSWWSGLIEEAENDLL
ncbi:hypothetical protein [Streptomyces sp. NRRL F-5630]|uniref:hypothetical protein n=1 Tax=Streptomyces sp. NRRL F-5630 TaxID=1463864 RepID=UPI003EBB87C5